MSLDFQPIFDTASIPVNNTLPLSHGPSNSSSSLALHLFPSLFAPIKPTDDGTNDNEQQSSSSCSTINSVNSSSTSSSTSSSSSTASSASYFNSSILPPEAEPEGGLLSTITTSDLLTQLYATPLNVPSSTPTIQKITSAPPPANKQIKPPTPKRPTKCLASKAKRKRPSLPTATSIPGSNASSPPAQATIAKRGRRISSNSTLPCHVCGQAYSRKDNLRAHMRVHSGEKPYKCSKCPESFRWLGALRKHTAMHACVNSSLPSPSAQKQEKQQTRSESKQNSNSNALRIDKVHQTQPPPQPQPQIQANWQNENLVVADEKPSDQFLADYAFSEPWTMPELNPNLLCIIPPSS